MFSDEVREKILSKEELQKLDLVTLSLAIHAIEEVLEEVKDDKQSLSDKYAMQSVCPMMCICLSNKKRYCAILWQHMVMKYLILLIWF